MWLFHIDHVSNWSRIADKCWQLPLWFPLFSSSFPKSVCPTQALRRPWCFLWLFKFFPTWKLRVALCNVPRWQISTTRKTNSSKNWPSATHALNKVSQLLNLSSSSLTDSLLGRGNYHVNLFLGPKVNTLNYEDTFVNFPTIPLGFGCHGCDWLVRNPSGKLAEGYF